MKKNETKTKSSLNSFDQLPVEQLNFVKGGEYLNRDPDMYMYDDIDDIDIDDDTDTKKKKTTSLFNTDDDDTTKTSSSYSII